MNFEKSLQNFIHENISNKIKLDRIFEMGQKFIVENEKEDGFLNFLTDYSKNENSKPAANLKIQFLGPEVLKIIYDASLMKYKEIKFPDSIDKHHNPKKPKKSASHSEKEDENFSEKGSVIEKSIENSNDNEFEKKTGEKNLIFKTKNLEYFPKVGKRGAPSDEENNNKRCNSNEKEMKLNRFFNKMPKFGNFNKKAQKVPNQTAYVDSPQRQKPSSPRLIKSPPEKLFDKPLPKTFTNPYCINWPKSILKYHYSINIEEKETEPLRLTTARFRFRKMKSQKSLPLKKGYMPTSPPEKTETNQNNIIQTENHYLTSNFLLSNSNRIMQTENNNYSSHLMIGNNFNGTTHFPNSHFANNDYITLLNDNFGEPTPQKSFFPNIKNSPLGKQNKRKKKKLEGEKEVDFFKIAENVRNIAKELYSTGDSDIFKKKDESNNSPLPIYSTNFLSNVKTNNIFPHIYKGIGNNSGDYDGGKLVISPEKLHSINY